MELNSYERALKRAKEFYAPLNNKVFTCKGVQYILFASPYFDGLGFLKRINADGSQEAFGVVSLREHDDVQVACRMVRRYIREHAKQTA